VHYGSLIGLCALLMLMCCGTGIPYMVAEACEQRTKLALHTTFLQMRQVVHCCYCRYCCRSQLHCRRSCFQQPCSDAGQPHIHPLHCPG
jgi:hypothetical protein